MNAAPKNLSKSETYYNNFPTISQKEIAKLKTNLDENNFNRSILKKSKKHSSKRVLFNINKIKIKNAQTTNNRNSSYINDSLVRTNYSKNNNDLIEALKKNEKQNKVNGINLNNEIINNNTIEPDNKILFKNRSQENLHSILKPKNTISNNSPVSKDSHEDNFIYDLNLIKELNSNDFLEPKVSEDNQLNIDSINNPLTNNINIEENKERTLNTSSQKRLSKISNKLPKLNQKKNKSKMPYILKSRKEHISANDIILHYLKENERDNSKNIPIINFKKYLEYTDDKKFNYGLDKIYGNSEKFLKRVEEIKKNNIIAYKKDFNIENYQNALLKILKKRVSQQNHQKLQKSYKLFNERNFDIIIPRGRYFNLAEKLKDFLSKDIYEKMKRTDRNYLIYLEKQEERRNRIIIENENKNNFYKILNNTLRNFDRKLRRNQSY